MAEQGQNRRRIYIVDKELQYHYLSAWLISAFLMICVFGFFVILFKVIPADQVIHREGVRNLYLALICNSFILIVFALMMGLHGVRHTHRVAGAAVHLRKGILKLIRRDYSYTIILRRKDYLKDLARSVNHLTESLRGDQEKLRGLAGELELLKAADGLPEPTRERLAAIERRLRELMLVTEENPQASSTPTGVAS